MKYTLKGGDSMYKALNMSEAKTIGDYYRKMFSAGQNDNIESTDSVDIPDEVLVDVPIILGF